MFKWIADYLIERAQRTPFLHLRNPDGSFYMRRFWLRPYSEDRSAIAIRVHHIADIDHDTALHDHPWNFISLVLRGGYIETRPVTIAPCFMPKVPGVEDAIMTFRDAGSIAFRRATDRHRIVHVKPDTWTLFITFKKLQWWGFYTMRGKVYYKDYETQHNTRGVKDA